MSLSDIISFVFSVSAILTKRGVNREIDNIMSTFEVRDHRNKSMFRVDDEYLNGYAKLCGTNATLVYLCLCRHADRHQESFPSVELMANKTGISKRSVIRGIATLIEWNVISKEKERRKDATWLNNRYILLDKTVWKSKPGATQSLGSQVPNETEPSAKYDTSQVPQVHTKDTHKKDTHTKENVQGTSGKETYNPLGAEILKAFEELNPAVAKLYGSPPQRRACDSLIETYGLEKVLSVVANTLPKTNTMEYFPTIITPNQLWNDWARLESKIMQYKSKTISKGRGFA